MIHIVFNKKEILKQNKVQSFSLIKKKVITDLISDAVYKYLTFFVFVKK